LAGCGRGEDTADVPDHERARLRARALVWLHNELNRQAERLKGDPRALRQQLQHWQRDPDLAGVREPEGLAALPPAEQPPWRQLWARVAKAVRCGTTAPAVAQHSE